jgi:hypothetical protein
VVYLRLSGQELAARLGGWWLAPNLEDLQRNHMVSLSLPCEKVLVCRQVIQLRNLDPAAPE